MNVWLDRLYYSKYSMKVTLDPMAMKVFVAPDPGIDSNKHKGL